MTMNQVPSIAASADMIAAQQICQDPSARRELLWLDASERRDYATARRLEQLDPGLVGRLREAHGDITPDTDLHALWNACFDRHASRLLRFCPTEAKSVE